MKRSVLNEINRRHIMAFTNVDLEFAFKQMHTTKALGLYVMPTLFYQKYWSMLGDRVFNAWLNVQGRL